MADSDVPTLADLATDLAEATPQSDVKEEPVEQAPTTEESSPEETITPDTAEEPAETDEEAADETAAEPEETPAPEPAPSKAEERKQQLNSEIRDLVTQRRDLQAEVERLNSQVYAPQSVDDIMAETGQSAVEARITAMEQQRDLDRYNNQVAESQLVLSAESQRVLQDFPMFNPDSPEFKPEVADQASQLLAANLITDPNTGQITGSHLSPYQLYKTIASANQASAVENQLKGQQNAERMLASAEPQSSAVPKQPKEDPFFTGLTKGLEDRLSGN